MHQSPFRKYWVAILAATLLTFGASVVFTVIQPMEYRNSFTVLVLEKSPTLDGYAAAKAAERLSTSLGQAILTTSFADQVYQQLKDNVSLQGNPLISPDTQTRQDAWKKEIATKVTPDVGQVEVQIYQANHDQAGVIANAVSIVTLANGADFLSSGTTAELKIVDFPITTKIPVRPNVFLNLAAGLFVGLAGAVTAVTLFAPRPQSPMFPQMIVAPVTPQLLQQAQMSMPAQPQPTPMVHQTVRPQPAPMPRQSMQAEPMPMHIPPVKSVAPTPVIHTATHAVPDGHRSKEHKSPDFFQAEDVTRAAEPRPVTPTPEAAPHDATQSYVMPDVTPKNLPISDDEWVMP